ncbi:MAG: nicotinate (nicotinamide) nucleotide adenylyltransferase [Castellaniella sp.]
MSASRVGLLGGSFDPVHLAHITIAQAAYTQLHLDEVQLIPAARPWQRSPLQASSEHRLAMLALVCERRDWLRINTLEIERNGPTYTIDTLRALPPDIAYYWILGGDQLRNFCSWHAWQEIAASVQLAVAPRADGLTAIPRALEAHLSSLGRRLIHLELPCQPVSATDIRARIAGRREVAHLLDPAVLDYIREHGLYLES